MKNGRFVDPLKLVLPASMPVKEEYKQEFQQLVDQYVPALQTPGENPVLAQGN